MFHRDKYESINECLLLRSRASTKIISFTDHQVSSSKLFSILSKVHCKEIISTDENENDDDFFKALNFLIKLTTCDLRTFE